MNGKQGSPVGVGVITILTVMLVLTLAVFSALTYASARADLNLSKINAQTVTDYYAADKEAAAMAAAFTAGPEASLEATIPMNDAQALYLQLAREADGALRIVAWKTVPVNGDAEAPGGLNVWDGTLPTN